MTIIRRGQSILAKGRREVHPIRQLAVRGTYSRGFRIPSFNEAYGLPTTGSQHDERELHHVRGVLRHPPESDADTGQQPDNTYGTSSSVARHDADRQSGSEAGTLAQLHRWYRGRADPERQLR